MGIKPMVRFVAIWIRMLVMLVKDKQGVSGSVMQPKAVMVLPVPVLQRYNCSYFRCCGWPVMQELTSAALLTYVEREVARVN